jgi:hypothetical protein
MVEKAIRVRAAELGIDEGTLVDSLAWTALLMPRGDNLKGVNLTDEMLERMFAEEALYHLQGDDALAALIKEISPENKNGDPLSDGAAHRAIHSLLRRWRTTRLIGKEHQASVLTVLSGLGVVPGILDQGLVDEDWFIP